MHLRHGVAQFVLLKQGELVGVPVIPYPFLCLPPYVFCGHRTVWVLCCVRFESSLCVVHDSSFQCVLFCCCHWLLRRACIEFH